MVYVVVTALVVGVVAWLVVRSPGQRKPNIPALRRELRKLTHDPAVAERLVAAEQKRHPDLGEATVLRRVIRRLRADRRR